MAQYEKDIHNAIRMMLTEKAECKIAIYPFGSIGLLVKRVLNEAYGIEPDFIFDEELSKYNKNIHSLTEYTARELENTVVLISSNNRACFDQIRETAFAYFKEENIYDICRKVCTFRDPRIEALRLNAKRINELRVRGNVAELGVYNGAFAKEINRYFKDRKLYLFDTFEGFLNEQLKSIADKKWMASLESKAFYFLPDDIERILSKFPYPEKLVIKKGFFPDTAEGIDDTFALVSLDVDIYESTKEGLKFFWPRMEKNAIIMVHDYNNYNCPGVKMAVEEFCKANAIAVCLLPDECGTAMLIK